MRFKHPVIAAAGAACLVSSEAQADAPPPAQAAAKTASVDAEARDWWARFDAWATADQILLNKTSAALHEIARVMRNNPSQYTPAAIRAWIFNQRKRLNDLEQQSVALRTTPAPQPPPSLAGDRRVNEFFMSASHFALSTSIAISRDAGFGRTALDDIERAAAGDAKTAQGLEAQSYEIEAVALESEHELLANAISATPASDPHVVLLRSVDEQMSCAIEVDRFVASALAGKPVDRAAVAASLRGHIGQIRNAGDALQRWTDQRLAAIRAATYGEKSRTPEQTRARDWAQSYADSGKVEKDIAAALDRVADVVADPKATPEQAVAQLNAVNPLLQRRGELENSRVAPTAS